ncbi:MAG: TIGR03546 family protein [Elusimicrobia bacterium]|nr:TIGR03546 family protein [Elusimicrobiota bacterium]
MFSFIRQFIKGLTKETDPDQIAGGIALGFVIGLIPKANLTAQLLIMLLMALRVNVPFAFLSIFFVSLINPLFDLISDPLGHYVLSIPSLNSFWTKIYNMPLVPWTDFNNTVLTGGLIIGIVLWTPVYLYSRKFAVVYNEKYKTKFLDSKAVKAFKKSWLLDWYFKES